MRRSCVCDARIVHVGLAHAHETVPGLTNGQPYAVAVRVNSAATPSTLTSSQSLFELPSTED